MVQPAPTPVPDEPTRRAASILVIDGNEEHQALSVTSLGRRGFSVAVADSVREGIELASARAFDAVVLAQKVRGVSGLQALRTVLARLPRIPVLFVVAEGSEDVARKALEAGASGCLVKTARYPELLPAEVEDQLSRTQSRLRSQERVLEGPETRREAAETSRAVVESTPTAVVAVDRQGNLTLWNPAAVKMFGWRPEEVLGKPLPTVPPDRKEEHLALRRRATQGEAVADFETRRMRKDGSLLDVRVSVAPLYDAEGRVTGTLGSLTDITEQKRAEKVQGAIYRISEAAASAASLEDLFKAIHGIVGELMYARNFYIALHDPGTDTLNFAYFVDSQEEPPPPQKLKRGLTEYVLRTRKPLLASPEVFNDLLRRDEVVLVGPYSIDWLGVPLDAGDRSIGVLVVQSYTEGVRYTEEDKEILRYVSTQVANAIERKRGEEALRDSEERYRLLFERNPEPMYVYDQETLRFLAVNESAVRHYGYSREEFLAMSLKDIRPPEDVPRLLESVAKAREGMEYAGEWRHRKKDGTLMDVEVTGHALRFGERRAELVVAIDVSERKRAQEALQSAEAQFRTLVEESLAGIYIIQDGRFAYVNPRAAEMFGYSLEEIADLKDVSEVVWEGDRQRVRENIARRMRGDVKSLEYGFRGRRKDGTYINLEVRGTRIDFKGRPAVLGTALDFTDRQRMEDELRRSERRFRTLFEAAADGIVVLDREGQILDLNPAAEAIIGAAREALVGRNLAEIVPADELERAREYMRETLRGTARTEPFSILVAALDGHRRFLEVHSKAVREEGHEPYVEMVLRDVTESREMQRRLAESERLASIGSMAGYVAHEINNPLANISLLVASAERKTRDAEILQKLSKISAQRRQAAGIISDLLSFSKQRAIETVDSDLRAVIEAAVDQVAPYRKKAVVLRLNLGPRPVTARVDPIQMQEVFVNLLKNALEATASGSVTVDLEEQGDALAVRVADTGAGMPPQVMDRLFEPFFTTKTKTGGTGLGLPLCRNVVTAHGGEIRVSTEVGKGSAFTVLLPRIPPSQETSP